MRSVEDRFNIPVMQRHVLLARTIGFLRIRMFDFLLSEIRPCDAAECTMIFSCNKENNLCRCRTQAGEKACTLKKPGVLETVESDIGTSMNSCSV